MSLSARARTVLSRFPRHLALDAPGTLFSAVVEGLAGHLDHVTGDLGRVRSAHRLGQVAEQADLLMLAALHGIRPVLLEPCMRRLAAASALAHGLLGDADARDAAVAALPDILGQAAGVWAAIGSETAEQVVARMAEAITALGRNAGTIERQRGVVVDLIAVHRSGNGSPGALLRGAAALLALKPGRQRRSRDDYWHVLDTEDRLRPVGAPTPRTDLLALEENPEKDVVLEPVPRSHRQHFTIARLGFGPVPVDIRVKAKEDRCMWPMVVDVNAGRALVYAKVLTAGQEVLFRSSGIVELDGVEAGNLAFAIDGGVFADVDYDATGIDFVFADAADPTAYADRAALFGVCRPVASALDGSLPHAGGLTPPISLRVGITNFRFFVREACFGTESAGVDVAAIPLFAAGIFNGSLAADAADAPAADVGFAWRERQPYRCTLWLPMRFSHLDGDGQIEIRERVRLALDRVRPAGVYLAVEYADDRWTLGDGVLRDADSAEPDGLIIHGTRLSLPEPVPV